jgi:hypothetical protein
VTAPSLNGRAAPPQDLEAEQAVLGAILLAGSPAVTDTAGLRPEHFYREPHGTVFAAMLALRDRGASVDPAALLAELRDRGDLKRAGGRAAVDLLAAAVPDVGNAREYARTVRRRSIERDRRSAALRVLDAPGDDAAVAALRDLADAPDATSRYEGRRYDFARLIADAATEPPWRVREVLADGHLTVLAALGGEGKTWGGLGFAGGVAHGSTVAGLQCAQGRAVILDAENGPYVLGARLGGLEPGLPADRVAIYDAAGLRLSDAADRAWMLAVIRDEGADLVVLDSLRTLAPDVAENDSDEMAPVIVGAKQLARDGGAAVLLLHHRGHDRTRDYRGSTAIRDQADLLFVLERDDRDPERRWRRRLRCAKSRIAPEPDDRWLGIRSHRGRTHLTEAAPPEPPERATAARDELADRILDHLAGHGPTRRADLARALGRSPKDGTIRRAIYRLVDAGDVVRAGGDGYTLTAEGANGPDGTPGTPGTPHREREGATGRHALKGGPGGTPPSDPDTLPIAGGAT